MNLLDLFVKISVDDQASKNVETLGSKIGAGLKSAAKIGVAAVGTAAAGIAALTKKSVEQYAEYEQLVGGVETLFEKAQGTVILNARKAFETAGLSANEYMQTVTSFSASLLQGLGGDTQLAAAVADKAITDMSDNANKMGTDMQMIQNAYNGFAKQNYTMLDNLKLGYGGTKEEMQRLLADASEIAGTEFELGNFADIIEAIHVIQVEMGVAGTTAKEASSTISGSAGMMKAAWTNLVTGMADENQNFTMLVSNFVESVAVFGENLLPRVEVVLGGVVQLIEQLGPKIIDALPGLVSTVLPPLIGAAGNLVGAVINILPSLAQTLIDVMTGALIEYAPGLVPATVQIILDLAMMLTDPATLIPLLDTAVFLILALSDGLIGALPQLIETAPVIIKRLIDALVYVMPQLTEAGWMMLISIVEAIITNLPAILDAGTEIVFAFVEGVVTYFGNVVQVGANIIDRVKEGVMGAISGAKTWGKDLIDNFIGGIKEKWENLKSTVSDVAQSIADRIGFSEPKTGPLSNFHTYAPDMMELFAQGVRENEHVVTDQIAKSFDFGERTIDFASSASGRSSAAMINGMMLSQGGAEEKTYIAELYLDGEKVAESTYRPLQDIGRREGEPAFA